MEGISKNRIKHIRSLQQKKFRQLDAEFIVEGAKLVQELLASDFTVKQVIYCDDALAEIHSAAIKISSKEMEQCSALKSPPGILAVAKTPDNQPISLGKINVILDDIKDPGNLGTIIRSAAWFGVDRLILTSDCVDIYNPKVVQSTMGGIFHIPISRASKAEILEATTDWTGSLLIADMGGKSSHSMKWPASLALVIGSESQGVDDLFRAAANEIVCIDKLGKGESLNAAVSASILLAQISS